MSTGYSRSPKLLKGALIEFSERFIGPVPNIIIFQYNPETMTRSLEVWNPAPRNQSGDGTGQPPTAEETAATAQPHDPPETFTLGLELDAADALEKPESHPVAFVSGVADRIAAMEMLLYPQGESLLGGLMGGISASLSGGGVSVGGSAAAATPVPRGTVPVLLFAWGPGRIVPVRLTSFSVEEQAYSPLLYPIRAKVNIGLKILTPEKDFPQPRTFTQDLAVAAFNFTRKQKEVLAAANLANSVESILGMLPF
ncbi:hypothetical protein L3C95_33035 [Chitinophaga filiformis]|uniref:hypothetical protein n=1 Tax=Chitinophaga filiformis TaxID=104663 RepID=UPI001F460F7A|nr:hypothetical protein [Chitinophaga filiformis]MCF6407759.1 hypothetical protein [Chitinophaga filiformis]